MSDLRQAAQQALEALLKVANAKLADGTYADKDCKLTLAIAALRAALAQQTEPQWCACEPTRCEGVGRCRWQAMKYVPPAQQAEQDQEPYCYVYEYDSAYGLHREFYPGPYNGKQKPDRSIPVYTHPPHSEWVPLAEEEIDSLWRKWVGTQRPNYSFTRAIEAALKEKNHG